MGEYGGGVWRCEEVSPHTSILHCGHRRTDGFILESRGPALHSPYAGQCLGEYLPVEGEPGQFRQRHTMDGGMACYMFQ